MKYPFKDIFQKRYSVRPLEEKGVTFFKSLSFGERCIAFILVVLFIISGVGLLFKVSNSFLVEIPEYGGSFHEGIIGPPRFINPLLAISDADKDLTSLVYSGLLKATPEGKLIPDLAKEWKVSEDGLTYTFTLKDDIYFQDGKPITTEDVEFSIQKAVDPLIKSPRRSSWEGVTVNKTNSTEIAFVLRQPYVPFIENATIGILPKHIWKNASSDEFAFSEYNVNPVGSGPYRVDKVKRNSAGLPTYFELGSFKEYALGRPFISKIYIHVYQNELELINGWKSHEVDSISGISAEKVAELNIDTADLHHASLPREFGVFFNQNQASIFLHKEVREALDLAVNKEEIIRSTLLGYGTEIEGPVPTFAGGSSVKKERSVEKALEVLSKNGWKLNADGIMQKKEEKLSFSLSTSDAPELKATATMLASMWKKIGISVDIKIFETGDLNQNVIRPRKYDALLFGMVVGRDIDLYPFWHSSQRNDPGLNIALYTNITTDRLLEQMRTVTDETKKAELYKNFEAEITKDIAAIFLYAPDFMYIVGSNIQNVILGHVTIPGERFLNIHEWFIETNKVWKVFAPKENLLEESTQTQ